MALLAQQLYASDVTFQLAEPVQARVKDPLWFLARQWQLGEFAAENGGRPASAVIAWSEFALQTLNRSGADEQLDLDAPLEFAVEREGASGDSPAWRAEALEHGFDLRTAAHQLRAQEYKGPSVDWYAVDLVAGAPPGSAVAPTATGTRQVVPTQLVVPGAPHPRWWRMEDPDTYFDSPKDPEPNVLSLLLPELGYVDVNDWYVVPLAQSAGTLLRITSLTVVDSFGVTTEVPSFALDGWQVFELTPDAGVDEMAARGLLFVPNSAVAILTNDEVEDVRFLRDEHANVVWAFEQTYRDEAGQLVRNGEAVPGPAPPPDPPPGLPDDAALPRYRFAAAGAPAWIPYVSRMVTDPGGAVTDLYLRRARTDPGASAARPQYHSRIVAEAWRLNEHEVPPDGVRVRRAHRFARGSDGGPFFWIGRRVEPAPRSTLPRTAFDYLE